MCNREIFAPDEQKLMNINKDWTRDELLNQEAIFFLKDVAKALCFDVLPLKSVAIRLANSGQDPWQTMGAARIFQHWVLRMTVFSVWYRNTILYKVRKPEKNWDGRQMLQAKGIFLLKDVCAVMPLSSQQICAQIRKDPGNARSILGVWKDEQTGVYLAEMEILAAWIRETWGDLIPS